VVVSIYKRWSDFFFSKAGPFNLSFTRLIFYLFLAQYTYFQDQFSKYWASLPGELWHPVAPMSFFSAPPLSVTQYIILFNTFIVFCLLSSIGLFTRISTLSCALTGTMIYSFRVSFLEGSHDNLTTVVFLWIFAFSQCGESLSLDSFFLKKRGAKENIKRLKQKVGEGVFNWPIKLMMIVFCSVYVSAAFSKLYNGGLEWIWGDTVKNYFIFSHYKTDLDRLGLSLGLGLKLSQFPLLCKVSGLLTLVVELGTILALFNTNAKRVFITAMFVWHIMFFFTSSNGFINMTILFFCWPDWKGLFDKWNLFRTKVYSF